MNTGCLFVMVLPRECFCLLSAHCVNFVYNVVQLSVPYFTLWDFLLENLDFRIFPNGKVVKIS